MNNSTKYVLERLIEKYPDLANEILDMQQKEVEKFKEHLVRQATAMIVPHIISSTVPDIHSLDIVEVAKEYLSYR